MSKRLASTLVVTALAACALAAPAAADESLAASGSITYTWQASPALGCAAVGLCGVQGALTMQSQRNTEATSLGRGALDLGVFGAPATVRVSGPNGDCVDTPGAPFAGDLFASKVHGRLLAHLQPPPSSGRCAGPREQDLADLTLPVRRSGGKHPSYDLRTSRSFVAGPFTGRLVSTVVLRPAPANGSSSSSSSGSYPGKPSPTVLIEQVTLRYRVSTLPGTLAMTFSGESDPFCSALASCGANGTLALSIGRWRRTIVVTAGRKVPRRVSARQAEADLLRGRLTVEFGGFPPFASPFVATSTTETIQQADDTRCQAETASRQAQLFGGPPNPAARSVHTLELTLNDPNDTGLLRTFCPGPNDTDVFGQRSLVAVGSLAPGQLLNRHNVLSLSSPGSFAGPGYVGTRSGSLPLALTLERVKAGTVEGPPQEFAP
jgi:hypothetical protein